MPDRRSPLGPTLALALAQAVSPAVAEIIHAGDSTGNVAQHDTVTGVTTPLGSLSLSGFAVGQVMGLAYDPVRDQVLLCDRGGASGTSPIVVYGMDATTGVATVAVNPTQQFQSGAVLDDVLYGIDEMTDTIVAYDLATGLAVPLSGGALPGHSHAVGIDMRGRSLYGAILTASGVYAVDAAGVARPRPTPWIPP